MFSCLSFLLPSSRPNLRIWLLHDELELEDALPDMHMDMVDMALHMDFHSLWGSEALHVEQQDPSTANAVALTQRSKRRVELDCCWNKIHFHFYFLQLRIA